MDPIFQTLSVFVISLAVLLFFGPIIVIITIIGRVQIGPLLIDLSRHSRSARTVIALVGLGTWVALYVPLVMLAFRAVIVQTPTPTSVNAPFQTPLMATPLPIWATQTTEAKLTALALSATATAANLPTATSTSEPPSPTVPPPTPTATVTNTALPTNTSIPTSTPAPVARITNYVNGDSVTQFISLMGDYRADLAGDLWVFVQDSGRYYPQSMNPCQGEGTPKNDGKWEIRTGIGVTNSLGDFYLVLTVTNMQASESISETLGNACHTGDFARASFSELPPGATEVQRIKVTRLAGSYGPMPQPPDANLPGQVTVAAFGEEGRVLPEEIITGTVSGATETSVWVLVFTYFGRWYPQSFLPCAGKHTLTSGEQWEAKVIFGDDRDGGLPFDVAVVVADARANAFFSEKQREWCQANHYPGLLTMDLPPGLTLKYHVRVTRR
jgi:hypothetical protein